MSLRIDGLALKTLTSTRSEKQFSFKRRGCRLLIRNSFHPRVSRQIPGAVFGWPETSYRNIPAAQARLTLLTGDNAKLGHRPYCSPVKSS
jgi:hypothetical protein